MDKKAAASAVASAILLEPGRLKSEVQKIVDMSPEDREAIVDYAIEMQNVWEVAPEWHRPIAAIWRKVQELASDPENWLRKLGESNWPTGH